MRIVFLFSMSLETPSALGRWYPWASELVALGHQVHIVALHHDLRPRVAKHVERQGVWIHYVGQSHTRKVGDATHYFSAARLLWVVLGGALGLTRQAAKLRADVYHVCKPHPQNSFAGWVVTRVLGRGKLYLDCDDLEAQINRFTGTWQRRGMTWLEDRFPRLVDGVTVHTRYLESKYRAAGVPDSRLLRLPTAIDRRRFEGAAGGDTAKWRARLMLGGQQVVAYVGTMALVSHPVDLLLQAFAALCTRHADVVLLLVGGGPDLDLLKEMAAQLGIGERCRFVGRVSAGEVPALLELADVAVDPVHDDLVAQARWPVKIMENMATGVPTITGDVGDRREMLGQGTAGLTVTPGDPQALADGLEAVLRDPTLRQRLSDGCRIQAARYRLGDAVSLLVRFYEDAGRVDSLTQGTG
jgi:glycosyltransferase involved in cell wall biosynthesis